MSILKYSSGINIYQEDCLPYFKEVGELQSFILSIVISKIEPGITTLELDKIAEKLIKKNKAVPLFKGFNNFPNCLCTSVNETVVHGIPNKTKLKERDVISIDLGVKLGRFCADSARTTIVGESVEHKELLEVCKAALFKAIPHAKVGNYTGDIGHCIHKEIIRLKITKRKPKYSIFDRFEGHGIGLSLHEEPGIPNIGYKNRGIKLMEGMCICIEPVVLYSSSKIDISIKNPEKVLQFTTNNLKPSAHFEHQIYISSNGPIILTDKYI